MCRGADRRRGVPRTGARGVRGGAPALAQPQGSLREVHRRRGRYTRDLVATLRRRGYFLLAVSQSPKYLVDRFARELGFDKIYGRLLEMDDCGHFTGGALFLDVIDKKAKVVRRAVEREGLTLAGSVGVGDTEVDVGFLELVERPICFNPNAALLRVATRRGWSVVVERKDVIHHIRSRQARTAGGY
jgi:phosphoserine phosphatase